MSAAVEVLGTTFQNPVLLAAGTCGFGREVAGVVELEALGGFVTKSVTVKPRTGNPAPRVTEFAGGMLNSIGLANPGVEGVVRDELPWIRRHVRRARVLVSVAGHTPEEYETLVGALAGEEGFVAFELNLSCPNDTRVEGLPFALDPHEVRNVVERCRARTSRPLVVKLAPNDPLPARTAAAAADAGADALTLVNTLPGRTLGPGGRPSLGAGSGGVSGPALLPVGLRAVTEARGAVDLPIVGVGGILSAADAAAYLRAGASLVQMGTASFADPRAPQRVARELTRVGATSSWSPRVPATSSRPPVPGGVP
jgi:dihydroorotate dehydrogenase (NAD+) catalytic subunit